MRPTWILLTTCVVLLALVGWLPRPLRAVATFLTTLLVLASGAVAVALEGARPPFRLAFLGAAVALVLAVGRLQPPGRPGHQSVRLVGTALAAGATLVSIGLATIGAATAIGYSIYSPPTPAVLRAEVLG